MRTRLNKDNTLMSTLLAAGLLMALAAPLVEAGNAADRAVMESAHRATDVMPAARHLAVEVQPAIIVSAPRLVRTA